MYIETPFNYTGSKYKILDQILPLFDYNKKNFIDLFAGCGGLSEGFLQSGKFEALAHVEWEIPMVNTLRNRLQKKWKHSEDDAHKFIVNKAMELRIPKLKLVNLIIENKIDI